MSPGLQAVAAIFTALQNPVPPPAGPLTLDEAINYASRQAFSILIQRSVAEKTRFRSAEQKASVLPTVYLNGTYTRNQREISGVGQNGTVQIYNPLSTFAVTSQISVPIDLSGNISRAIRALQLSERASFATLDATINDVRLNTRQAFFNELRAQQQVEVYKQSLADAEGRRDQARLQYQGAQIARVDLDRFETQVDQARADLINGQNSLQISKNQFNLAISRPIETPVELIPPAELPKVDAGAETLVALGQQQRPEIRSLRFTLESLTVIRKARETSLFPSLTANLNYSRNIEGVGFGQATENINAQLLVKIPIFDNGLSRAQVAQAKEDEKQAQYQIEQTKLSISNEVRNALTNIESTQARLANALAQQKLAEEVFRLSKIKQEAGEGTYVEVIDAQTQLTQARTAVINARFDYFTSFAQLQRAVGNDQLQPSAKEPAEQLKSEKATRGSAK